MFDSPIEQIKQKIDIVDLIQEYIPLKQAGANFKAPCPFHHEKTPSFVVSRDRQIWHCFGACLLPDALIKTINGCRRIQEIRVGEQVFTHKGRFRPVMKVWRRRYNGEAVDIRVRKSSSVISLTNDHKVYAVKTKNCKQKSRETRICQERCRQNCPTKYFKDYKIKEIPAREISLNDYLLFPINKEVWDVSIINLNEYLTRYIDPYRRRFAKFPKIIKVNQDFLQLMGYWIAEGGVDKYGHVRFFIGNHEHSFKRDIVKLIKKVFGLKSTVYKKVRKNNTGTNITVNSSDLANIFANLCGKGVFYKHIPFDLQYLPPKKQRIILEAIFRGDGNYGIVSKTKIGREYKAISTISPVLAEQLRDILLRLGIIPTVTTNKAKTDKRGTSHRQSYVIHWQESIKLNFADIYTIDRTSYAVFPVKEVIKRKFKGNVYNLTVDDDHSYTTENFVVANCGEGGDIFKFIMQMEGMEFGDALRFLAHKAGVVLRRQDPKLQTKRAKLLEILDLASQFYHQALLQSRAGEIGREYIKKRQIDDLTIDQFRVGFAPDRWDELYKFLKRRGFQDADILDSGLVIKKQSLTANRYTLNAGCFDRFRNRLMFPIFDAHNNVVGFGGRVFPGQKNQDGTEPAKYINTPQTFVYDKSRVLYGLNFAKHEIRKQKKVVIVEGYMDVIGSHQAGATNIVAASGTALTLSQIELLKRYSENAVLAFDMDLAGDNATKRGIDLAVNQGLNVKIARIPEGKDPDEFIKAQGKDAWQKIIDSAVSIMDYYFNTTFSTLDKNKVEDKKKATTVLIPVIANIPNPVEQTHYLQKLAKEILVTENDLRDYFEAYKKKIYRYQKKETPKIAVAKKVESSHDILLSRLFGLLFKYPDYLKLVIDNFPLEYLSADAEPWHGVYKDILNVYNKEQKVDLNDFSQKLKKNNPDLALKISEGGLYYEKDESEELDAEKEILNLCRCIVQEVLERKLKEIEENMNKAERAGDHEKINQLLTQFSKISGELVGAKK